MVNNSHHFLFDSKLHHEINMYTHESNRGMWELG